VHPGIRAFVHVCHTLQPVGTSTRSALPQRRSRP
jgi:hypothetical protein